MLVCSSPQLIAAYHVLHRLSEPRHPPCALNCFKKIRIFVRNDYALLTIKVTRYYNFFSQYVKELNQLPICKCANCIMTYADVQDYEPADLYVNINDLKNFSISNCKLLIRQFALVEDIGVEPMTLCVQGRCSSQLS